MNLIISILLFVSCGSLEQNSKTQKDTNVIAVENTKQRDKSTWINYKYLTCLKDSLPCECLDKVAYTLLNIDLENHLIMIYERNSDGGELYIKENKANNYDIFLAPKNATTPFLNMRIESDTLYLSDNGIVSQFVRDNSFEDEGYNTIIGKLNLNSVINRIGTENNFINKVNITDLSGLLCNSEIGNINLLSTSGQCENKWIIERKGEKLLIYKFENSCADKSIPFEIKKTLIYSFP